MALLYDARFRATDANDEPLNGATLTVYNANTTTLTSVFSNTGLTTPLVNPVVADSAGRFPQIFVAEGTAVDLLLKTSAGVLVTSYDDVIVLGADDGDLTRTLADSTRFKVRGSGGVVYIETGDASPDNTGGTAVLGGWAGTQGDSLDINYAAVDIGGIVTEAGKSLQGVVQTAATTFTAAATVDIALPNTPTGTRAWMVEVFDLSISTDANVLGRLSYDNGATYKAGATDYAHGWVRNENATPNGSASTGSTSMLLISGMDSRADDGGYMRMMVITVPSGNGTTMIEGCACTWWTTGPVPQKIDFMQLGQGNYGKATHLRLLTSAGTLTGKYRVVPLRGF